MNIHVYGAYCHGYHIVYKHWNYEIMRETRLHPNLLTDWHDALVGISPRTTQQLPQIVTFVVEVSGHFSCPEFILSLSHRYCRGNFRRVIRRITRDLLLLKRYCFLFQA